MVKGVVTWSNLGNKLNKYYGEDIYFIDCARIDANITDWSKNGKYYNLANNCLGIAYNFSKRYNVLWQEGPQDNYYSYENNYFIDTLTNLVNPSSYWYISLSTYGTIDDTRWEKLNDIISLTHDFNNIYLGADMDSECMEYPL